MNNKIKLAIEVIAIVALIFIVINLIKSNFSNDESSGTEIAISNIQYNETSGEYYIEDEETGEVLHTGYSEDELYIYTIDSDYEVWNPNETDNENTE